MKNLHGLKEAVGTYQKNHKDNHCVIYLDLEDGSIWTRVYTQDDKPTSYRCRTTPALNTYIQDATGDIKVTMQSIRKTAEFVAARYAGKEEER